MRRRVLLAIMLACCAVAQAKPDDKALTAGLQALHRDAGFPGFAVATVSKDGVTYRHGFGYADLGAGPITIRHLVTHTSGIVDDDTYGHAYYLNAYSDRRSALLKRFTQEYTVPGRADTSLGGFLRGYLAAGGRDFKASNFSAAPSGSTYDYSNIGAALAAYLVELKSGQRFDVFCQTHIFQPLGMRHTGWSINDGLAARHARLYDTGKQAYPLYSLITYPDGGLITSADDLAIFLVEMIKGYRGESALLGKASFRLLFDKQFADDAIPAGSPKGEPNGGIFWRYEANGLIGHSGSDPGVTTFMAFDPVQGTGKIFLTNSDFGDAGEDGSPRAMTRFKAIWSALDR
ncbi:serine hydrolase domain-containing protein [Massilia scottii]|uniref:serine hydrolase domain-containing protein n=1 Tax=Massilia scottii TaxID=3057166 RepID=UPI002796B010|nr:serine hydrolase domain-containing protein [Massilia sp. CCM 9029]MDQ1829750.1 serine hydrolase domain-containing protein [Massilia sp. CCM 9029]